MDSKDSEFLKRIQATFRIEAEEHLKTFSAALIELEKTQTKESLAEIIEAMFREVHSLKGAARSVGQKEIESVCLPLEGIFSMLKRKEIPLTPAAFDLFYKTLELLSKIISTGGLERIPDGRQNLRDLILQLKMVAPGTKDEGRGTKDEGREKKDEGRGTKTENLTDFPKSIKPSLSEVVRIPISKLDPLLFQAEELVQAKIAISQRTSELIEIRDEIIEWKTESLKWRGSQSGAASTLWNEWQEGNEMRLNDLESRMTSVVRSMDRDQHSLNRMVDDHLEAMKQVLMLPVASLVEVFPGMVREISHEQNKEIDFILRGTELEIDKRILEELKDPLIHLIRNSIDHGIETPQERSQQNKPPRGIIVLSFTPRENGQVEITISDDGKGIDRDRVLRAAIKAGALSAEAAEKLDPKEVLSLIFHSGVSTSSIITDISGRGLGLTIVREKVEKLTGKLSLDTETQGGTTFHILLPMSLATFRGILIGLNGDTFILPTMNVERVIRVTPEEIKTVENHETILVDQQVLSLVGLAETLGLPEHTRSKKSDQPDSNQVRIVVLVSGENRMAFKLDDVLDELQVLVKGLGKLLSRVRNISGATVLGSGKVVPVLNVADLMKSAIGITGRIKGAPAEETMALKTGNILVVEDSITSRTLLKNILETAGYQVTTAVDGVDAYTRVRTGGFDLVVSDVDMPRMNGFELTAKIRSDKKLSEIPVVLVTALELREDREQGIEVGADAYIIKSSFDQGNLLEVVKRLIG